MDELLNKKVHNLHSSSHIVRATDIRRMRWVEQVACTMEQTFGYETSREDTLEYLNKDGRIILK
jgi:hypothetical protein